METGKGRSVLVVSVFTGEPADLSQTKKKALVRIGNMSERKVEDRRAMQRLGVDYLWLGHCEANFRDKGYQTLYGIFSRFSAADHELSQRIGSEIERICRQAQPQRLYFPLGVGNHADHRLLFEVGAQLMNLAGNQFEPFYYEDAPYSFIPNLLEYRLRAARVSAAWNDSWGRRSLWEKAGETYSRMFKLSPVQAQVKNWLLRAIAYLFILYRFGADTHWGSPIKPRMVLSPEVCDISSVNEEKLNAIADYQSQIKPVLGDLNTYRILSKEYSLRIGSSQILERVWKADS